MGRPGIAGDPVDPENVLGSLGMLICSVGSDREVPGSDRSAKLVVGNLTDVFFCFPRLEKGYLGVWPS